MSASWPTSTPENMSTLPDEELIREICALTEKIKQLSVTLKLTQASSPQDQTEVELKHELDQFITRRSIPGNVLFTRHHESVTCALAGIIFRSGWCPRRWDKETFLA